MPPKYNENLIFVVPRVYYALWMLYYINHTRLYLDLDHYVCVCPQREGSPFLRSTMLLTIFSIIQPAREARGVLFTDLTIYLYGGTSADLSKIPPLLGGIVICNRR